MAGDTLETSIFIHVKRGEASGVGKFQKQLGETRGNSGKLGETRGNSGNSGKLGDHNFKAYFAKNEP